MKELTRNAVEVTATVFELNPEQLFSGKQKHNITQTQHVVFWLLCTKLHYEQKDIAEQFNCTRQNVSYAVNKVDYQRRKYPDLGDKINKLLSKFSRG